MVPGSWICGGVDGIDARLQSLGGQNSDAVVRPATSGSFRALQQSRAKLIAGIVVAWMLGGILRSLFSGGSFSNQSNHC